MLFLIRLLSFSIAVSGCIFLIYNSTDIGPMIAAVAVIVSLSFIMIAAHINDKTRKLRRLEERFGADAVPPASERPCPMCAKAIPARAKLCYHCKSDLTWTRHLQISQTSLALWTALVAVLGSSLSQIIALLGFNSASLDVAPLATRDKTLIAIAANTGQKPAYLLRTTIIVEIPSKTISDGYVFLSPDDAPVIESGKASKVVMPATAATSKKIWEGFISESLPSDAVCMTISSYSSADGTDAAVKNLDCSTVGHLVAGSLARFHRDKAKSK